MPVIDKILFKGISCVLSTQIGWDCAAVSGKKIALIDFYLDKGGVAFYMGDVN
jgi:hypothetical protein